MLRSEGQIQISLVIAGSAWTAVEPRRAPPNSPALSTAAACASLVRSQAVVILASPTTIPLHTPGL